MTEKKKTGRHDSADLRKRAEEALRTSEAKYRLVVENANEAIAVAQDGMLKFVNRMAIDLTGYSEQDLTSRPFPEFVHPDDRGMVVEHYLRRLKGDVSQPRYVFRLMVRDGSIKWLEIGAVLIEWEGNPATLNFFSDVTERKRAEEALRESKEFAENLIASMQDGISVLDRDGVQIDVNAAFCQMTGFSREELIGVGLPHPFWPPEAYEEIEKGFQKTLRGEFSNVDVVFMRKNGERFPVIVSPSWVKDKKGNVISCFATVKDITERKRAEEALKKSSQLLRDTGEMAKVGGWELDLSTKEVSWTEEVDRIHGVEPGYRPKLEEALNFYAPESRPAVEEALKKAAETGEPYDLESLFIPSGSKDKIWVRSLGRAVTSGGKIVKLAGTFQNIDKYKRVEEALRVSLEKYRVLFESFPLGITISDKSGKIMEANRQSERLLGITQEEHAQRRIDGKEWQIIRKDGTPMPADEYASTRALRESRLIENVEMGIVKDKGEITWISVTAAPIPLEGYGVAIAYRDISERLRAEKEIQSLAKFPTENPDPILRIARDGTLLYINQAGLNLLPEWHLQVGKATPLMLREAVLQVMDNGSTQRLDLEHRRQIYSFSVVPVVDGGYANLYARDVSERRKAEEALRKSESDLRALALELSRVEESERQRLALFLHDEISQSLALLRMKFGSLAGVWESKSRKQNIQQIRDLLEKVIDQTHTLTFELSPPVLHQLGLEAAIEWAGEKISQDFGIEFVFSDDGMIKPLSADIKALMFRCVRELMSNTVKHAKAKRMTVSLTRREDRIFVVVEDDGVGFDISLFGRPTEKVGFGLFSVRERLGAVGGAYEFHSEPGRGTRITVSVPLKEEMPSS